jgi:hypothetical protein
VSGPQRKILKKCGPPWIQIPASRIIAHRAAHPDTFQSSHAAYHYMNSYQMWSLERVYQPVARRTAHLAPDGVDALADIKPLSYTTT